MLSAVVTRIVCAVTAVIKSALHKVRLTPSTIIVQETVTYSKDPALCETPGAYQMQLARSATHSPSVRGT